MSPAEELRAAATRLEELAAGATPGPWMARYTDREGWPVDTAELTEFDDEHDVIDDLEGEFNLVAGSALPKPNGRDQGHYEPQHVIAEYDDHDSPDQDRERWANLQWAALLNPLVAAPLVAWLRDAAERAEVFAKAHVWDIAQGNAHSDALRPALTFARVINGTTS